MLSLSSSATHRVDLRTPPGPRGTWLLGNLRDFREDQLRFYERCRDEFGDVVAFRLGTIRLVLLSDPAAIEEVLVTKNHDFRKHFGTRLLQPILGSSLLLSEGETWLKQRRIMQPAFGRRMTEAFTEVVGRQTERLAADWQVKPQRDLYRDMTQLTSRISCEAFLGVDWAQDLETLSQAMECLHADYERRLQSFWPLPLWVPTRANRCLRGAIHTLDSIIRKIIAMRDAGPCDGADALSLLLKARRHGAGMSDTQLRDEVMTLLLAGHDTTANTLSWCWFLLGQHPQIMEKLRQETADIPPARFPGADDIPRLKFAHNVVQEAMRLYPPVHTLGREALRNTTVAGYPIRRVTGVLLCQWLVHRDPRLYDRPLDFLPERWEESRSAQLPHYAFFPFGGGPRVCVGKDLAMVEAVCILAGLAARFQITLDAKQKVVPWPTATLRPRDGILARVDPAKQSAKPENQNAT